jgi:flagellar hook-associated protein 2
MGLAVDGLSSGLDTTSLINSLMKLEAVPQTLLKNKVSDTQSFITALQGLNTKIASLADLATTTSKSATFDLYRATSSSTNAAAAVTSGASAGQIDLVVNALATRQVGVSAALASWPVDPPVLTIVGSDGTKTQVTAATTSLDDVVTAINDADAGVSAMKVSAGGGQYRLQFTATATGLAGSFDIYHGTSDEVTAGTATSVFADPGAARITDAADATVTLWAGSTAAQTITSSTNTFADLLPGVDVTVSAASADPLTITVARDDTAVSKVAADFVSSLNGVFALISTKSVVTNSIGADGKPVLSSGVFTGDTSVQAVNQSILSAASLPVNGRSPSEIGISITKTGELEFDGVKFAAAYAADPDATGEMVQAIAARVASVATETSDKYDGQITSRINGQQELVDSINLQVSDWDRRLEARRSNLERTYAALEVQLSGLKSQSSWLTSQLGSLPQGSGNS